MPFHQKTVKAGVLLYALLMAAVFSLLLQFYVHRHLANHQLHQASLHATLADAMAELTRQEALKTPSPSGKPAPSEQHLSFNHGHTHYKKTETNYQITVTLKTGETFSYTFPLSSKTP